MRKSAPVAFFAASFLIFTGLITAAPAYADDDEDSSSEILEIGDGDQSENYLPKPPKRFGEQKRKELEERYGKQGQLSVPPLVIRPMRDTDDVVEAEDDEDSDTDDDSASTSTSTTQISSTQLPVDGKVSGAKILGGQPPTQGTGSLSSSSLTGNGARFIAVNPVSAGSAGVAGVTATGQQVNPEQNTAIDIRNVSLTRKTPADVFLQAAQVGLFAMGAGAIVLAVLAVTRTIRRK